MHLIYLKFHFYLDNDFFEFDYLYNLQIYIGTYQKKCFAKIHYKELVHPLSFFHIMNVYNHKNNFVNKIFTITD